MEEIAAEEPEPAPGWLLDNLAGTQAEMFALMLEAWASEPTVSAVNTVWARARPRGCPGQGGEAIRPH
jgi:hypothetical protein